MAADGHEVVRVDLGDGLYVRVPSGETVDQDPAPAEWQVPRIAVALGLGLGLLVLARLGASPHGILAAGMICVLVVLAGVDIRARVLPNRIILPAFTAVLAWQVGFFPERSGEWLLGALGAAAMILLPCLLRPGAMGMGDVKLAALLGAALGWEVLPALMVGFLAILPVALFTLVRKGAEGRAATLPLGPFLAFGGALSLLG
jgi:leader peptidase (prepilin peptidase)/N-methyltransferase